MWLITEINILRCTVSKTSKFTYVAFRVTVFAYKLMWAVLKTVLRGEKPVAASKYVRVVKY